MTSYKTQFVLIKQLKNKDDDAFKHIIEEFSKRILNYIFKFVLNYHDAEELTQDTFVRAYKYIHNLKPDSNIKAWLYTIARNVCYSKFKKKILKTVPIDIIKEFISNNSIDNPDNHLDKKELQQNIMNCVNKLEFPHKEVFILFHYENFSYQEISEILKIPIGTVRSRMHYALKNVQKDIREIWNKGLVDKNDLY